MIELRKVEDPKDKRRYQLLINNLPLNSVYVRGVPDKDGQIYFDISTSDIRSSQQIAAYSLEKFLPIEYLRLEYYFNDLDHFFDSVNILISEAYKWKRIEDPVSDGPRGEVLHLGTYTCSISFQPNLSEWREEYSFADYAVSIYRSFRGLDDSVDVSILDYEGSYLNKRAFDEGGFREYLSVDPDEIEKRSIEKFSITFPYSSPQAVIEDELKRFCRTFQLLHREAVDILTYKARNKSVSKFFDFPPEASVACEQYLLYFSQFLRDLGVEATADLKHEAGRLLFTVTPANTEEALENIQAALSVYLALPANPISDPSAEDDVEVQRLSANIDHLKGQLRLAQAESEPMRPLFKCSNFTFNRCTACSAARYCLTQ